MQKDLQVVVLGADLPVHVSGCEGYPDPYPLAFFRNRKWTEPMRTSDSHRASGIGKAQTGNSGDLFVAQYWHLFHRAGYTMMRMSTCLPNIHNRYPRASANSHLSRAFSANHTL